MFIDFDNLQTTMSPLKVQRLSFLPLDQTEEVGWYFRDDDLWREYGCQVRGSGSLNVKTPWSLSLTLNSHSSFLYLRAPPSWLQPSAVKMSSCSSPSTLREPLASQWALQATHSTSPVCINLLELVEFNDCFCVWLNIALPCRYDSSK